MKQEEAYSDKPSVQASNECTLCKASTLVFDAETSETICSSCGTVVNDNAESLGPEWRVYSTEDIQSRGRTGMPTSLTFHDMGLSTFISYSNVDANGAA